MTQGHKLVPNSTLHFKNRPHYHSTLSFFFPSPPRSRDTRTSPHLITANFSTIPGKFFIQVFSKQFITRVTKTKILTTNNTHKKNKTSRSFKKLGKLHILQLTNLFFIEMAHNYRGNNHVSIPITAVIPIMLSLSPRESGKMSICRPHSRRITVVTASF